MTKIDDTHLTIYTSIVNGLPASQLPVNARLMMIHDALLLWQKRNTLTTPMAEIIRDRVESGITDLGIAMYQHELLNAPISQDVMTQCNDLFEALYDMNLDDLSKDYILYHNKYGIMKLDQSHKF